MSGLLRTSYPVARKQYRCESCLKLIQPGTRYARHLRKDEDTNNLFARCAWCEECERKFRTWPEITAALGESEETDVVE